MKKTKNSDLFEEADKGKKKLLKTADKILKDDTKDKSKFD